MTAVSAPVIWGAADARRVLSEAFGFWPQDRETGKTLKMAVRGVLDALDLHEALESGALGWEIIYPHLHVAADPRADAEQMAAEEAGIRARVLRKVLEDARNGNGGTR